MAASVTRKKVFCKWQPFYLQHHCNYITGWVVVLQPKDDVLLFFFYFAFKHIYWFSFNFFLPFYTKRLASSSSISCYMLLWYLHEKSGFPLGMWRGSSHRKFKFMLKITFTEMKPINAYASIMQQIGFSFGLRCLWENRFSVLVGFNQNKIIVMSVRKKVILGNGNLICDRLPQIANQYFVADGDIIWVSCHQWIKNKQTKIHTHPHTHTHTHKTKQNKIPLAFFCLH